MDSPSPRLVWFFTLAFAAGGLLGYVLAPRGATLTGEAAAKNEHSRSDAQGGSAGDKAGASRLPAEEMHHVTKSISPVELAGEFFRIARQPDVYQRQSEIYTLASKLDSADLSEALTATLQLAPGTRASIQPAILSRWLDVDPTAAFAWVRALPTGSHRASLLREGFYSLGLKDPQTALRFAAQQDPAGERRRDDPTRMIFKGWAQGDPGEAARAALALPQSTTRNAALDSVFSKWAALDPHAALASLSQLTDPAERRGYLRTVFQAWVRVDAAAAASHVHTLDPVQREQVLGEVLRDIAPTDGPTAEKLLALIPDAHARSEQIKSLLNALSSSDLAIASRLVLQLSPEDQRLHSTTVARELAKVDRAAALRWAGELARPATRNHVTAEIIGTWAREDPKAAVAYSLQHFPAEDDGPLQKALCGWTRHDETTALAWVRALTDASQKERLLGAVANGLRADKPDRAMRIVESMAPGGEGRKNAAGNIATIWAGKEPLAALTWLWQIEPGAVSGAFVMSTAARRDPVATAEWMKQLPVGTQRDDLVANFARMIVADEPGAALAWVTSISNLERRRNSLGNVFSTWCRADRPAALAWLRATPLVDEEQRAQYHKVADRYR